ncbi:hypothetical protein ACFSJS_06055 [Streptomyces desertarenae]|uniref:Uncharacterized protein n=1 Tax=Streptomyces desertarenae TaxID=2666184 RepID=A0ABW4PG67_9ACTN
MTLTAPPSFPQWPRPPAAPDPPGLPDALDVPEEAGRALLRRRLRTGAVAWDPATARTRFLVPPGSAEELPGLLEWLEWGGIGLDLTVLAAYDPREAAVWLRPPGWGCGTGLAGLAALVSAAAAECHRVRLLRAAQPFAFS